MARRSEQGSPKTRRPAYDPDVFEARRLQKARRRRKVVLFTRIVGALAIIGATAAWGAPVAQKLLHPYEVGAQVRAQVAETEARLAAQKERNRRLKDQIEHLQSDAGIESAARALGWRTPGETVYYLPATEPVTDAATPSPSPGASPAAAPKKGL